MPPPIWLVLHGHLIWWAALVLSLVGGWWAERAFRRWRSKVRWRARAGAVPAGTIDDGGAVRLTGTLRVVSEHVKRFEDGAHAAVASAAAGPRPDFDAECVSLRAEQLWLDTKAGAIELRGAIEVVGGRVIRTARAPTGAAWSRLCAALGDDPGWPFTALPVELRSVAHGDRVEVAGRLERAVDDDTADYRTAMRRILVAGETPILVQLATPMPARAWRLPLALTLAFAVLNMLQLAALDSWEYRQGPLAWLSPLTRPGALRELRWRFERSQYYFGWRHVSSHDLLALGMAANPDAGCATRARWLRAAVDDLDGALRELDGCEGVAALRERTLVLATHPHGPDEEIDASWRALALQLDADCEARRECPPGALDMAPNYYSFRFRSEVPRDLFIGRVYVDRPHVEHRLATMLDEMTLRSEAMRHERVMRMLALATFELTLDQNERAAEILDRVATRLQAGELSSAETARRLRDTEHMQVIVALRRGELDRARTIVDSHEDEDPCGMQLVVATAAHAGGGAAEDLAGSHMAQLDRVRAAFAGEPPAVPRYWRHSSYETLAWIEHVGRRSPPTTLERLGFRYRDPSICRDSLRHEAATWGAALARAYAAVGEAERAERIRACVARAHDVILARSPLETY